MSYIVRPLFRILPDGDGRAPGRVDNRGWNRNTIFIC